jgi:hypothetical protein
MVAAHVVGYRLWKSPGSAASRHALVLRHVDLRREHRTVAQIYNIHWTGTPEGTGRSAAIAAWAPRSLSERGAGVVLATVWASRRRRPPAPIRVRAVRRRRSCRSRCASGRGSVRALARRRGAQDIGGGGDVAARAGVHRRTRSRRRSGSPRGGDGSVGARLRALRAPSVSSYGVRPPPRSATSPRSFSRTTVSATRRVVGRPRRAADGGGGGVRRPRMDARVRAGRGRAVPRAEPRGDGGRGADARDDGGPAAVGVDAGRRERGARRAGDRRRRGVGAGTRAARTGSRR